MLRTLRVAAAALADLEGIRGWLQQDGAGPKAAARLNRIILAILELETSACRWAVGQHHGIRERPIEGYRIMYEVVPDLGDVHVLRVFGPGQDRSLV